jgi:hypothetical protein
VVSWKLPNGLDHVGVVSRPQRRGGAPAGRAQHRPRRAEEDVLFRLDHDRPLPLVPRHGARALKNHPHPIREANEQLEHALHLDARRKLRIVAVVDVLKGLSVLGDRLRPAERATATCSRPAACRCCACSTSIDRWPGRAASSRCCTPPTTRRAAGARRLRLRGAALRRGLGPVALRNWARWLGIVLCGIYVPFELYYLFRTPSWTSVSVLPSTSPCCGCCGRAARIPPPSARNATA